MGMFDDIVHRPERSLDQLITAGSQAGDPGLPKNRMGIKITPKLMGMYLKGLERQRVVYRAAQLKAKKTKGLHRKLADPNSKLNKGEKVMLKSMLAADRIGERTDEGALMGIRQNMQI
jgi:hypothetical protein